MFQRFIQSVFCLLIFASFLPKSIFGADIVGRHFSDRLTENEIELRLTGAGLFRYYGIKAYIGALYLEAGIPIDTALSDHAKRIEIEYMRSFTGENFGQATIKGIVQNVDKKTYQHLYPKILYHNSLYEDVRPGDRYSLTYIPGVGTHLAKNGEPKGIIEGSEFAFALFSIWIGPHPINASFKKKLLGQ